MTRIEEAKARLASTVSDVKELRKMYQYIDDHDIKWYDDFVDYCMDNNPLWFQLLSDRYTYAVSSYIKRRAKRLWEEARKEI